MLIPIALYNNGLWIDGANVVAILPVNEATRASQGWHARFNAQVVAVSGQGGLLDVRRVSELVRAFRYAGVKLGYVRETDEAVKHEAISSLRAFESDPNATVQYFHSAAILTNGRELWLAATPKQVLDSKPGRSPAPRG